ALTRSSGRRRMARGAGSRQPGTPPKPHLVAVGVDIGDLAYAVHVRLPLRGLQSPLGYLGHPGVEVIDDDGGHGVDGVFGPPRDVHRPGLPGQNWGVPADMLVGRRLVIGALRSAVDAAVGGAGGVVLLAGEAGMGKTALASEAVAYAKAQGAV